MLTNIRKERTFPYLFIHLAMFSPPLRTWLFVSNVNFWIKVYIRFVVFIDLFIFLVTFCKYPTKIYIHFIDFIGFQKRIIL